MTILSSPVSEKGQVTLPKSIRNILHIKKHGEIVGFIVEGNTVKLTRAKIVPDTSLTEDEIALCARWSKQHRGRRVFKNAKSALKYLWRL